jgi:hypothetical protein
MTSSTDRLIHDLAANVKPVRALAWPSTRAAVWLALALPCLLLTVFLLGPADGSVSRFSDPRFVIEQIAALATGITAAIAAFATTAPGYNRAIVLAPLAPFAIWTGDLGESCIHDLGRIGTQSWAVMGHWACFPITLFVGALPAILMAVMLRRGAPVTPRLTAWLGALAVAGLSNVGVRVVHASDASVIVLVWHMGAVLGVAGMLGLAGRRLLPWRGVTFSAS